MKARFAWLISFMWVALVLVPVTEANAPRALAVPRHVVEMGDPDTSNDKPASGPNARAVPISYSTASTSISSASARKEAKGNTLVALFLSYWRALAARGLE